MFVIVELGLKLREFNMFSPSTDLAIVFILDWFMCIGF